MDGKGMHMGFPAPRMGYNPAALSFNGKQIRKTVHRRTIDYNTTVIKYLENRIWQRDRPEDSKWIIPDALYNCELVTPSAMRDNPMNCVTTKFIRQSTNKVRCPIFCVAWTPEGRRLITGASSGEFTLWNGLTFNFETILQAHDAAVRSMIWSHNDQWMLTADHAGFVKYWQSNMNNVQMYQAHKEAIRGTSFCPTDNKYVTCSDDGTVRIWDFVRCYEERVLRGHGADVKCVDWHPQKSLIVSGSKDAQQPMKLWDARTGQSLTTVYAHKNTVMSVKWNNNGNWFLTASRDHLIKLFDIRKMKGELQSFKGHKKEATTVAWHPVYEEFFTSGGSDGSIMFWLVGTDKEVGSMENAHEGFVWSLAWHPTGHILVSGSNDHSTKFWSRNKPGDNMKDRYNLNLLPGEDGTELMDDSTSMSANAASIPGMGLEDGMADQQNKEDGIPGLDFNARDEGYEPEKRNRIAFAKPISKSFEAAWEGRSKQPLLKAPDESKEGAEHRAPGMVSAAAAAGAHPDHPMEQPRFRPMHHGGPRPPLGLPFRPPPPIGMRYGGGGPLLGDRPPAVLPPPPHLGLRPPLLGSQPPPVLPGQPPPPMLTSQPPPSVLSGQPLPMVTSQPPPVSSVHASQPPPIAPGSQQGPPPTVPPPTTAGVHQYAARPSMLPVQQPPMGAAGHGAAGQRSGTAVDDGGGSRFQSDDQREDGFYKRQEVDRKETAYDEYEDVDYRKLAHQRPGQAQERGESNHMRAPFTNRGRSDDALQQPPLPHSTIRGAQDPFPKPGGSQMHPMHGPAAVGFATGAGQPLDDSSAVDPDDDSHFGGYQPGGAPYSRGNNGPPFHSAGHKRNWQEGPGAPQGGGYRPPTGPHNPVHGGPPGHSHGHPRQPYYGGPPPARGRPPGQPYMSRDTR